VHGTEQPALIEQKGQPSVLEIRSAALSARILPEAGGGLAGFDWHGRGESIPLMRRYTPLSNSRAHPIDPNRLACYPLVPWSNRIAENGFHVDGRWIALTPNREGEPWPIHGSGWQRAWQVQLHTVREVRLSLRESSATAYSYAAILHYVLHDDALQIDLAVTNTGSATMPFGLGLHPFFPRHGEVRLFAPAPQCGSTMVSHHCRLNASPFLSIGISGTNAHCRARDWITLFTHGRAMRRSTGRHYGSACGSAPTSMLSYCIRQPAATFSVSSRSIIPSTRFIYPGERSPTV
jgi:hypothetical protein